MEKFIILKMLEPDLFQLGSIIEVSDIAYCNHSFELLIFDSFQEAANYRDEYCLDGSIVELPLY